MNALKLISILLKLVQIILLVAGLGAVAYFTKEIYDLAKNQPGYDPRFDPYDLGIYGRYEFYLYNTGVGVGIALVGLVFAITGLLERKYGAFAILAIQSICILQLLVSTALLAKLLANFNTEHTPGSKTSCEVWDESDSNFTCGQLIGGVACGFTAMVLFAVDTTISFTYFIRGPQSNSLFHYQE